MNKRVALGVSGGIAAYKAAEVLRGLQRAGCTVRVAMSQRACEFVQPLTFRALSGSHVIVDDYAPDNPDPIAHITFSQTVDLFIIAPATANIIAKFANGVADDFLTSTYLASTAPVLIAPAMNTTMWLHPATQRNIQKLREDGVHVIEPDAGEMACGTIGPGRLSEPERIVAAALEILTGMGQKRVQDLAGEHLLITTGATREAIDPVRFISNRSSGRMGFGLAEAARDRAATVTAVAGITNSDSPPGIRLVRATSAAEMHARLIERLATPRYSSRLRPWPITVRHIRQPRRLEKSEPSFNLSLERTQDILGEVASARTNGLLIVGFAAETNDVIANASSKLKSKNLDAVVTNDVSRDDIGFDSDMNAVTIISRDTPEPLNYPRCPSLRLHTASWTRSSD